MVANRHSIVLAGLGCLMLAATGCATSRFDCPDLAAGHELVVHVKSWTQPLAVNNLGPGVVIVTVDAEGESGDWSEPLEVATRFVALNGETTVVVSNPAPAGTGVVHVVLSIEHAESFRVDLRERVVKK